MCDWPTTTGLLFLSITLCVPAWAGGNSANNAGLPAVTAAQRALLSRIARRTVRDVVLERPTYEPGYIPSSLGGVESEVVVRFRVGGYLLAHAAAGPKPLAFAARDAALAVGQAVARDRELGADLVDQALIELEVIGPGEPIDVSGDWTQPGVLDRHVEPGVHGLAFGGPTVSHRFCPTELYTTDLVLPDALRRFAETSHLDPTSLGDVRIFRFATLHWYQTPDEKIVDLHRGMTPVAPDALSRSRLDEEIAGLAEYMRYRQQSTGLFAYQYEMGHDRYSPEDNLVRQAGAALALAAHAARSGSEASRAGAALAIRHHLDGLTDLPHADNAAFIGTPDGENKLGVTALVCLALCVHPDRDEHAGTIKRLVNGMLAAQRESGMFITSFPPAVTLRGQDYFPGEALLALAQAYARDPDVRILDAFDRAVSFYQGYFRDGPAAAFVPWQAQAFTLMATMSKRTDFRAYVFELTDWLAAKQLDESNCAWPELRGGVAAHQRGRAGVATAAYLEGFVDALTLARAVGDEARAERYERVVRAAARFVIQLRVRPEEAYFCPSHRDAVGGVRASPALDLLRIDHCQHALIALMKTRDSLFPDPR